MINFYQVKQDCQCWNCKNTVKAGESALHQYDDLILCDICTDEMIAHNDYIESVSKDYPTI